MNVNETIERVRAALGSDAAFGVKTQYQPGNTRNMWRSYVTVKSGTIDDEIVGLGDTHEASLADALPQVVQAHRERVSALQKRTAELEAQLRKLEEAIAPAKPAEPFGPYMFAARRVGWRDDVTPEQPMPHAFDGADVTYRVALNTLPESAELVLLKNGVRVRSIDVVAPGASKNGVISLAGLKFAADDMLGFRVHRGGQGLFDAAISVQPILTAK